MSSTVILALFIIEAVLWVLIGLYVSDRISKMRDK